MKAFAVEVKDAAFSYVDKAVFSGLSFKVEKGQVFCIMGPNGCGKTTLLDCILGLLKPEQGDILINGTSIRKFKPKQLAKEIAYIPQLHQRTFPYTVMEVVLMGRAHNTSVFSAPGSNDRKIAEQALDKVGIRHLADKPYTQISGGECQLVMVARALAQQPDIIVMDEPTSHLDFKNELIMLETIADLVTVNNITVIMATHFPNHAFYLEANHIPVTLALMNRGMFESIGRPGDVLKEENIKRIYGITAKVISHEIDERTCIRQVIPLNTSKTDS